MAENVTDFENVHAIGPSEDPDDEGPDVQNANTIVPASRFAAGLSGRQLSAIPAIVSSPTIRQAARKLEISERTIYRWLEDQDFCQELARQRDAVANLAVQEIRGLLARTASVYAELMEHSDPSIRLRATRYASTLAFQIHEDQGLRTQLETLEQALDEWKSRNPLS